MTTRPASGPDRTGADRAGPRRSAAGRRRRHLASPGPEPAGPEPSGRELSGRELSGTEPWPEPDARLERGFYVVVLIDIVGSAAATGPAQRRMRSDLYDVVDGALARHGFGLASFPLDDTGDGLRIFLPFDRVHPTDAVDMFILGLLVGLRRHRRYATEEARLRVRVAFDLGLVEPHLQGRAGDPLVRVARLVDAEPLREALARNPGQDLAAVVSESMYEIVVRPGDGYLGADCFTPVAVRVKEFTARAWLLEPQRSGMCGSGDDAAA